MRQRGNEAKRRRLKRRKGERAKERGDEGESKERAERKKKRSKVINEFLECVCIVTKKTRKKLL